MGPWSNGGGSAVMARQQASPSNSNPGLDCRSRVCLHYDHVQELLVIDEVVGVLGVLARIELNPVNLTVEFSATPRRGPSCAAIQSGDNQSKYENPFPLHLFFPRVGFKPPVSARCVHRASSDRKVRPCLAEPAI